MRFQRDVICYALLRFEVWNFDRKNVPKLQKLLRNFQTTNKIDLWQSTVQQLIVQVINQVVWLISQESNRALIISNRNDKSIIIFYNVICVHCPWYYCLLVISIVQHLIKITLHQLLLILFVLMYKLCLVISIYMAMKLQLDI